VLRQEDARRRQACSEFGQRLARLVAQRLVVAAEPQLSGPSAAGAIQHRITVCAARKLPRLRVHHLTGAHSVQRSWLLEPRSSEPNGRASHARVSPEQQQKKLRQHEAGGPHVRAPAGAKPPRQACGAGPGGAARALEPTRRHETQLATWARGLDRAAAVSPLRRPLLTGSRPLIGWLLGFRGEQSRRPLSAASPLVWGVPRPAARRDSCRSTPAPPRARGVRADARGVSRGGWDQRQWLHVGR
jgi:hypothetical protein